MDGSDLGNDLSTVRVRREDADATAMTEQAVGLKRRKLSSDGWEANANPIANVIVKEEETDSGQEAEADEASGKKVVEEPTSAACGGPGRLTKEDTFPLDEITRGVETQAALLAVDKGGEDGDGGLGEDAAAASEGPAVDSERFSKDSSGDEKNGSSGIEYSEAELPFGGEEQGDDEEEKEALWDLKLLLPPSQILKSNPVLCSTPGCSLVACCIWSSNLDAETPWYCCLDCQEDDFGGWPEKREEIPAKEVSDEWREAARKKCTNADEPEMPDLPTGATEKEGSDSEEDEPSSEAGGGEDESSAEEEAEAPPVEPYESGDEETWELAKIFGVKEINKAKPILCMSDDCELVACSEWKCNIPDDPDWRTCLDCQENDYEGWPVPDSGELPVKYLSEEDREAISEKCTNQDDPALPDLPTVPPASTVEETLAARQKDRNIISATTPIGNRGSVVTDPETAREEDRDKGPTATSTRNRKDRDKSLAITPSSNRDSTVAEVKSGAKVGAARGNEGQNFPNPFPASNLALQRKQIRDFFELVGTKLLDARKNKGEMQQDGIGTKDYVAGLQIGFYSHVRDWLAFQRKNHHQIPESHIDKARHLMAEFEDIIAKLEKAGSDKASFCYYFGDCEDVIEELKNEFPMKV